MAAYLAALFLFMSVFVILPCDCTGVQALPQNFPRLQIDYFDFFPLQMMP